MSPQQSNARQPQPVLFLILLQGLQATGVQSCLVAGPAIHGVRKVANDDVKGAVLCLLQLRLCVVNDELQSAVLEGSLVGLQVLLTEGANHLRWCSSK